MSFSGTGIVARDPQLSFDDNITQPCTAPNCLVCKSQQIITVPRARSRSPVTRPGSPPENFGLDLTYNLNSGPSISSASNYSFVQPTLSQNSQWVSNNPTVDNQEAGHSSSSSSSSSAMASQPKTRRRIRIAEPRTPPPVAIIDLTTDTPTPPPPPPPPPYRERQLDRQYRYDPDDTQDSIENISYPLYSTSYASFSNEENFGGLFQTTDPAVVRATSNSSTYYDYQSLPIKGSNKPKKPVDPAPAINDSVDGETVVLSCPICFEELRPTRKPTSTKCGHVFCEECLEATLIAHKKCPKCNAPIKRKSCIRLFL